jgi:tRNA dimethylallyltransferase
LTGAPSLAIAASIRRAPSSLAATSGLTRVTAINIAARIWLIAGPTASGKSALALWLAQQTDGEIVNADALQLYADLRVLSARPSPEDEAAAPHHLFGVADAADGWSVGRWAREALPVLDAIAARGRPAIVVGGTGLYFRALTQGIADVPEVPQAIAHELVKLGEPALREQLRAVDAAAEVRIFPGDLQRLTRALAVAQTTGRALSDWQAETHPLLAPRSWRGVVLEPPRAALYDRCDARLAAMMEAGGLDEVRTLMARGLSPDLPALKAVGLRELAAYLAGEAALPAALAEAQQATRRFAKRQLTWFRNQTPGWPRIDAVEPHDQQRQFLALEGTLTASRAHGI